MARQPSSSVSSRAQSPPASDVNAPSAAPIEKETIPIIAGGKSESDASSATESSATVAEPTDSNQTQAPTTSAVDSHTGPEARAQTVVTESVVHEAKDSSVPPPQETPEARFLSATGSQARAQPATTPARGARAGAGRTCDHELEQSEEGRVRRLLKTRTLFNTLERLDARQHATLLRERQRVQMCLFQFNYTSIHLQ